MQGFDRVPVLHSPAAKRAPIWLCLACLATLGAAPPPDTERQAIETLVAYLKSMNHDEAARRLQEGFDSKPRRITFGVVRDRAETPVGQPTTVYNESALQEIFPAHLRGKPDPLAVIGWAATVVHEMKHQDQDPWAWKGGFWGGLTAGRNPCDQEAWGQGFQALADHARRLKEKLDRAPGARERAEIGRELALVCTSYQNYLGSFEGVRGEIGEVLITDPEGVSVPVKEALKEIEGLGKAGRDAVGNASVMLGEKSGISGAWNVTVRYLDAKPPWSSRGEWILEQNNLRVFGRARMTDRKGKMVDGTAQGTMKGDQLSLEVRLGNLIEIYEGKVDGNFASVGGSTLRGNHALAAMDGALSGLTGFDGTKVGHMSEEQLRKGIQPANAAWSAKARP